MDLNLTSSSQSNVATAEPTCTIAPYGGAIFNLEEGLIVPYLAPMELGLSPPTGGNNNSFAFTKHANEKRL
jgi:hypothetical protein